MRQRVWSVSLIKDELDIFGYTIEHLLAQDLDGILIADNMSDDGTQEMVREYARKYPQLIHVLIDKQVAWFQARKMNALAAYAHEHGADWILPCDADEWYRHSGRHTVGEILRTCPHRVVGMEIYHYFATALDDPREPNPYRRMTWRNKEVSRLHKVAYRWSPSLQLEAGNHALIEGPNRVMDYEYGLELRHFPYRSAEQFLHSIENVYTALKATNFPRSYGGHGWQYGEHLDKTGPDGVKAWWKQWFYLDRPEDSLVYDPLELMVHA